MNDLCDNARCFAVDCGQFDSTRSYGSAKDGADTKEAMYGVGNLQSSPAMKTFYNKALLSTASPDMVHDFALVRDAFLLQVQQRSPADRVSNIHFRSVCLEL